MKSLLAVLFTSLIVVSMCFAHETEDANKTEDIVYEQFDDLKDWEPFSFRKIEKETLYRIEQHGTLSVLAAYSESSASALISKKRFSLQRYPTLKWRWKIAASIPGGDASRKSGDDFAIRLMVVFEYEPDKKTWLQRRRHAAAKLIYGRYPPHSAVSYVWANHKWQDSTMENAYSSDTIMIATDSGNDLTGQWRKHSRNVLNDYRQAFNQDPPENARLVVMSDSDDTHSAGKAWIDWISLGANE